MTTALWRLLPGETNSNMPCWCGGAGVMDRRRFVSSALGMAGALAVAPSLVAQLEGVPPSLPSHRLLETDEDAYWAEMRKQFLIPQDMVYLNNGTVGSSP